MTDSKPLQDTISALAAAIEDSEKDVVLADEIEFPVTVSAIKSTGGAPSPLRIATGAWVAIRPVGDEKTYLGVYLGDLPAEAMHFYHRVKQELRILLRTNPAIFVPDLKRVVWGAESWWGVIRTPADLRRITDADIQNVWYVRALKELTAEPPTAGGKGTTE